MDIDNFRNFIAVVDYGSLSAAAEHLHIAQPALTAQIKKLQKNYGAKLLRIRQGARNIEVTDAGIILYNKAKYILAFEDNMQREITACEQGIAGKLRISLSPSMSSSFIKTFLSGFARSFPQVQYDLYEVPIKEQTNQLLSGITEIGIANAPLLQPHKFETLFQKRERLGIIFHKDTHWLSCSDAMLDLSELSGIPLCLSRGCSSLFLDVCSASGLQPHILSITTTKTAAITWALQQLGIAVVPIGPGEQFNEDLICRFIQDERLFLNKTLSVVKGRTLSNVAKNFISYYNEHS